MIHVFNINLDAINKRHALFESLHTFWSEFSFVGDKRNAPAVSFPGIRIGSNRRLLPVVDATQICFRNVSSQPYVIEIGEGYNGRSRVDTTSPSSACRTAITPADGARNVVYSRLMRESPRFRALL